MFNHTLKNFYSLFTPGKKDNVRSGRDEQPKQANWNEEEGSVRLLYPRDTNQAGLAETKPETMQHDWWIN